MIPVAWRQFKDESKERVIADYIAGMTDRYANQIYESLN
jgi:dGTP triphosphohydrolase